MNCRSNLHTLTVRQVALCSMIKIIFCVICDTVHLIICRAKSLKMPFAVSLLTQIVNVELVYSLDIAIIKVIIKTRTLVLSFSAMLLLIISANNNSYLDNMRTVNGGHILFSNVPLLFFAYYSLGRQ